MFRKLTTFSLPEIEQKVLEFWRTNQIFKQVRERKADKNFVFFEGPPTANGSPHMGHVETRAFKDIMLRYKTMQGFGISRKAGWDTHGLPVELEVEKKLGLNSKKDIEAYGIAEFNKKCKESVWEYKDLWEKMTERIGFWIDMDDPYITYENSYMESVWWILSQIWKKKLLYKGHKVVPWCPRCGTGLSSHELAQGYKEVTDTSITVAFHLQKGQKAGKLELGDHTYLFSWTTTPWTLPGNVALAVGKDITYAVVKDQESDRLFVVADNLRESLELSGEVMGTIKGKDLVGLTYEPLFPVDVFFESDTAYQVYPADFVSTEEGTGVVHTAVMYGPDDYELGRALGLPEHHTVDEDGKFNDSVPAELRGMYVKDEATENTIINHLKEKKLLFASHDHRHEYPFCWRCDTPILYYARSSWFIEMSKLRSELLKANDQVNWIPEHTKDGRFGEWLRGVKDWALSRERYWGTPLPIWECDECGHQTMIGDMDTLSEKLGGPKNTYILLRHGEAESNTGQIVSSTIETGKAHGLTERGTEQVEVAIKELKKAKVDGIYSSDFRRTTETAEMVGKALGVEVSFDPRLREINTGIFDGKSVEEYHRHFTGLSEKFTKRPTDGEHLHDVAKRMFDVISTLEEKHNGKTFVIVSHEYPLWMLETTLRGWSKERAVQEKLHKERAGQYDFITTAEVRKVPLKVLPRNEWNLADLHRPFIDEATFVCGSCKKGTMKRVPEVIDVWFDAGSMPYAQWHYPFENKELVDKKIQFPADYITEAVDQTRGWFYTLLAISVLLGHKSPYKTVISLGHVLDEKGQKLSKSKGNYVDPQEAADTVGFDVIRWYFYTVNAPGEPKRYDEKELQKVVRNFFMLVYNSFVFLNTYQEKKINLSSVPKPTHVLDRWIFARLNTVIRDTQKALDEYRIGDAARDIGVLVDDLSKWYIRRSRQRFQKPDSPEDFQLASQVLAHALIEISKLIAPFTPFFAEALYESLKGVVSGYDFKKSAHLEMWSKTDEKIDTTLLEDMELVRVAASVGLAKREEAGIKVRQPLATLTLKDDSLSGKEELLDLLKDEVNVKEIVFFSDLEESAVLDTELTHELKEEGWMRELARSIQGVRRDAGLAPGDTIILGIQTEGALVAAINRLQKSLQESVGATSIEPKALTKHEAIKETRIDDFPVTITLKRE